jgi:hypothetical protein
MSECGCKETIDEWKLAECIGDYRKTQGALLSTEDLARYLKDNQKEFLI